MPSSARSSIAPKKTSPATRAAWGSPSFRATCAVRGKNLQRQNIKEMLNNWEREYPGRSQTIFTAMQNVKPSHLLDGSLFDFRNIQLGATVEEGDVAFD